MKKWQLALIGVAIGLLAALIFPTKSASNTLPGQNVIKVKTADGVSPVNSQVFGVNALGSAIIGPKKGDSGQVLQNTVNNIIGN